MESIYSFVWVRGCDVTWEFYVSWQFHGIWRKNLNSVDWCRDCLQKGAKWLTKRCKKGAGPVWPFSVFTGLAGSLATICATSLPSPLAEVLHVLLSAHYSFQIFPPFAMNALSAWICTTKPLLHPPLTKRASKLYTLFRYWGIWHYHSFALL